MALNPQSFFNFAAQNYPLLHDLFRRDGGMNDAELADLIRRHRVGVESPAASRRRWGMVSTSDDKGDD